MLFFSSCQKESLDQNTSESSIDTSLRNANHVHSCRDLVINGDFEADLPAVHAFLNSPVSNWDCYRSSADLVGPEWNWLDVYPNSFWSNYTFDNNVAFLCTGGQSNTHAEGIKQDVNIVQGVEYLLSFEFASTAWKNFPDNGNQILGVQLTDLNITNCITESNTPPPSCSTGTYCYELPIESDKIYPEFKSISTCFTAPMNANSISFWTDSDNSNAALDNPEGAFIDNVRLTCINHNAQEIIVTEGPDCTFTFRVAFQDESQASNNGYAWQFGDGQFDIGSQQVTHTYNSPFAYNVSVIVLDQNQCCKELTTSVACIPCTSHICHEELIDPNFQCVVGVRYLDPVTSLPARLPFTNVCNSVDFECLEIEIESAIMSMAYSVEVLTKDPTENIICYKAGIGETLGLFVYGDVFVTNLIGIPGGWNNPGDPINTCVVDINSIDIESPNLILGTTFEDCKP